MHRYGVRDVEALLRMSRSTIRALVGAGFVAPTRGPRGAWRFSFQDLIALRTAQALVAARVPPRRIVRSIRELRRHLPVAMPLSGLAIGAVGDRVVVRERGGRWQADSGQYLLAFEGDPAQGSLSVIERAEAPTSTHDAKTWFERAVTAERADVEAAIRAYQAAIAADPELLDSYVNLGRLLHEGRRHSDAERVYRAGLAACGNDALLLYNLGVLLDDQARDEEALAAYEAALACDPALADCLYNLALLCERLARPRDAIRHMARYRQLTGSRSS